MVGAHQAMYGGGGGEGGGRHGSETVGAGAAMQALKMFTGGGGGGGGGGMMGGGGGHQGGGYQGGGGGQNAFVGMAMGQASKLFDQQSQEGRLVSSISLFPRFCYPSVVLIGSTILAIPS